MRKRCLSIYTFNYKKLALILKKTTFRDMNNNLNHIHDYLFLILEQMILSQRCRGITSISLLGWKNIHISKIGFELVSKLSFPFKPYKHITVISKQTTTKIRILHLTLICWFKNIFPLFRGYSRKSIFWKSLKSHLPIYWVKLEIILDCHLWDRITLIFH